MAKIEKKKKTWGRIEPQPWKPQTKYWRSRDGTSTRLCNMDDWHLVNTLRMLKRNAIKRVAVIKEKSKKYNTGPEEEFSVTVGNEQIWTCLKDLTWRRVTTSIFGYMEIEAERRGIEWERTHVLD
jgi:hypothetical protein